MHLRLYATDRHGQREEITCLYWFEEQMVHDWGDDDHVFEVWLDDTCVWKNDDPQSTWSSCRDRIPFTEPLEH